MVSPDRQEHLIIFARYPTIGKVKTRLIPDLGAEATTAIYTQMAELTLKQARTLRLIRNITIEVWFTGGTKAEMQAWLGDDLDYQEQIGETLGDRLIYALKTAINNGSKSVIIIGTDCPELDAKILGQGFSQLQDHDLVLGAANDGGYYLIGLQKFVPELFINIPWSTSEVFLKTVNMAEILRMSQFVLPTLTDVDTAKDLSIWEQVRRQNEQVDCNPKISIIIPTLNEAENLAKVLQSIANAENVEIIIVDAGSSDQTVAIAQSQSIKVVSGVTGRAKQMNLGASIATGEILLFLHGDTVLPFGFEQSVREILAQPTKRTIAGAFKLKINGKGWGLRLVEWGVSMRSQLCQMPYGDQAIFMNTSKFLRLGGFRDLPIMEDFEIILQLRTQGRIRISPLAVTTSARRWQKLGIFSTTLINQIMIIGYLWGVQPTKLAQWYKKYKNKNS
ncbi:hypothetical protein Syn7502_02773 [Synechococcus sp. PCC 7502]|uniref:TIGR04283 family arsenosugar biosynthesis glycosyltransferase n=1 Tax=Synechococcus sp. PCC 7502 TaxID=1173263 RepID=UPI00029F9737|nr:TIGR04283 family arsenosugar biosynthesis glycosyltransferase [Synechococcus sp. PCC 7502]AFY74711.1 hypothetical protein Syn7502_02773 [Synechococcus sp. PCC 7502]